MSRLAVTFTLAVALALACSEDFDAKTAGAKKKKDGGELELDPGAKAKEKEVVDALNKKYKECGGKGQAWVPALKGEESAAANGSCTGLLVTFCCTLDELKKRYAGAEAFEPKITARAEEGYQIYSCSKPDDGGGVKVHLIKRAKQKTSYDEITITGVGSDSGGAACAIDLKKILSGEKVVVGGEGEDKEFTDKVNPILKKSCGGKGCHANGNTSPPPYVDNRASFLTGKTTIPERLESESSPMPPKTSPQLTDDEKKTLIDYLKGAKGT